MSERGRVTFGIRVPNSGPLASPESIVEVAGEAESLGYDSIWVHDHLTWSEEIHRTHISSGSDDSQTGNAGPDFYEAITTLSYLAGLVRSIRLGIACVVVPCRNPLLAAKQLASLDVFCKGRLDIGLGIGSPSTIKSREYEVLGVNKKLRGKIADDHIRAMKAIWTSQPSTYEGQFVSFKDAEICPKPYQKPHPPLWIGGWTEAAMKRTAALGDGWLPAWLLPQDIGERFRELKEWAARLGRNPDAIHLGIEVYGCIDEDAKKARENGLGTLAIGQSTFERFMTVDQLAEVSLIGSPEEIRRTVSAYADAGVSHFEIKFIYPTLKEHSRMLQLFAREVLPAFR
ncbi:MAG TPA: TIGR03619 family F420-dependent LLM class oxidoreductase [Methylomirabilota bacterium]|nr:TIGR03619 family F420-dependent LLM class oxidoreductase [Methylomirabilota bacterium]